MLAIVNSAAVNIAVNVSFQIMIFSRYVPRSGVAGSYDHSILGCRGPAPADPGYSKERRRRRPIYLNIHQGYKE